MGKLKIVLALSLALNVLTLGGTLLGLRWRGALHERTVALEDMASRADRCRVEELRRCSQALDRFGARPSAVLIGASITHHLAPAQYFPKRSYRVAAISGQTSDQIRARFERDALALHPRVVFLAGDGGINRLLHRGATEAQVAALLDDVEAMTTAAKTAGVGVVVGSVLPTNPSRDPELAAAATQIPRANQRLAAYAKAASVTYLDLYGLLAGPDGSLRAELTDDGLHPNEAGRRRIAQAIDEALQRVLRAPEPAKPAPPSAAPSPTRPGTQP